MRSLLVSLLNLYLLCIFGRIILSWFPVISAELPQQGKPVSAWHPDVAYHYIEVAA